MRKGIYNIAPTEWIPFIDYSCETQTLILQIALQILVKILVTNHRKKCHNFTEFPGVEILWKGTVSAKFRAIHPKLCGNCAFPQNFHTWKLGEIAVFYAYS